MQEIAKVEDIKATEEELKEKLWKQLNNMVKKMQKKLLS